MLIFCSPHGTIIEPFYRIIGKSLQLGASPERSIANSLRKTPLKIATPIHEASFTPIIWTAIMH